MRLWCPILQGKRISLFLTNISCVFGKKFSTLLLPNNDLTYIDYRYIMFLSYISIIYINTTLQLMPTATLMPKQLFQYLCKDTWFYARFDILQESGIKYLPANFLTESEPEFLHAFVTVFWKKFILIRQHFHCAVCDINHIDQHFYPFTAANHVAA